MSTERDELAEIVESVSIIRDKGERRNWETRIADAILAAGYRKPRTITEYSIVFNGHASGLIPPATSIAEFQERYERETGWMLTDRDVYIQRTFQTIDPEFGDWELMPTTAPEPLP